ncbi:hypothetical protein EBB07_10545 [Paenibacillaceae bacterium]|nr:hypothetical protein EBB07_10545 [Paenibacillaceae bacterium]
MLVGTQARSCATSASFVWLTAKKYRPTARWELRVLQKTGDNVVAVCFANDKHRPYKKNHQPLSERGLMVFLRAGAVRRSVIFRKTA